MTPAQDLVSVEYDRHKAEVIRTVASKLSSSGIRMSDFDLDGSYNEAWHALYLTLVEGEEVKNRVGYLVTVTHRRALNEFRAQKVSRRADPGTIDEVGVDLDIDSQLDAEIQLRQIREGLQAKLSSRELEAATLCHLYGYTRPEAAEAMGVRPKRMEKIMDRASSRINSVVEAVQSGEHCAGLESTIRAFALGLLDPDGDKYRLASEHLEHCPACRREVWMERGLAAIGPPLPIAFALLAGGAGITGGAAGAISLVEGGGGAAGVAGVQAGATGQAGISAGKGGAAVGQGASTARKTAVAGGAVAAAAIVAVAVGVATGKVGGDSGSGPEGKPAASLASAGGGAGGGGSGSAASAQAAKAARKAAERARLKAAAEKRRRARAAAAAAEAAAAAAAAEEAAAAAVPESAYVPPVEAPAPVEPAPDPPKAERPEPDRKPEPAPEKPDRPEAPSRPAKPTTDAGEEFGLR